MDTRSVPTERLPRLTKAIYALGTFGPATGPGTIIPFFFLYFLTDVVRMNPGLAGLALLVGKIWDAVNDPIVGLLTDRTRTRWGRRRPFLLLGAIPFGLLFFALWIAPPWRSQLALVVHFVLLYILFDAAFTAVGVPYGALAPEMSLDYDERTSLYAYQMAVSIGGGLIGAVLPLTIVNLFPDKRTGFAAMGALFGVLFALPLLLVFAVVREREEFQGRETPPPLESLRMVLRNRPMRFIIGLDILSWTTVDILAAVFIYYLVYWIGVSEEQGSMVLGVVLASALVYLPLFNFLSRRMEKKWAYVIGMSFWVLVQMVIFLIPRGAVSVTYPLAVLAGLGVSAAHVMPSSMRADVIEVDELSSGARQEGIYMSVSVFLRKLATSLALAGIGTALDRAGYVPGGPQPESALLAIRVFMGPVPALLLLSAIVLASFYPITREKHRALLEELRLRREGP